MGQSVGWEKGIWGSHPESPEEGGLTLGAGIIWVYSGEVLNLLGGLAPHRLVFSDFLSWCSLASWGCPISLFIHSKNLY